MGPGKGFVLELRISKKQGAGAWEAGNGNQRVRWRGDAMVLREDCVFLFPSTSEKPTLGGFSSFHKCLSSDRYVPGPH